MQQPSVCTVYSPGGLATWRALHQGFLKQVCAVPGPIPLQAFKTPRNVALSISVAAQDFEALPMEVSVP